MERGEGRRPWPLAEGERHATPIPAHGGGATSPDIGYVTMDPASLQWVPRREGAERMTADHRPRGAADFDFLIGRRWLIRNRRLVRPGAGERGWQEFGGTLEGWFLLGGLGNVDSFYLDTPPVWGSSVRFFDPAGGTWKIYWADSTEPSLRLQAEGRFIDGRGEFFGSEVHDGVRVDRRFLWLDISDHAARWERAFRHEDGSWETDWIMELRASRAPRLV